MSSLVKPLEEMTQVASFTAWDQHQPFLGPWDYFFIGREMQRLNTPVSKHMGCVRAFSLLGVTAEDTLNIHCWEPHGICQRGSFSCYSAVANGVTSCEMPGSVNPLCHRKATT